MNLEISIKICKYGLRSCNEDMIIIKNNSKWYKDICRNYNRRP